MSSAIRIVPVRDGRRLVHPWRFFTQGNEVYAANDQELKVGMKVSLHSSGTWKVDIGNKRFNLGPGVRTDEFHHAMQIQLCVADGPGIPRIARKKSSTKLIEIPLTAGNKMMLDIAYRDTAGPLRPRPANEFPKFMWGAMPFWKSKLRSDKSVFASWRINPLSEADIAQLNFFLTQLRVRFAGARPTFKTPPSCTDSQFGVSPDGYNILRVFQLSESVFVGQDEP